MAGCKGMEERRGRVCKGTGCTSVCMRYSWIVCIPLQTEWGRLQCLHGGLTMWWAGCMASAGRGSLTRADMRDAMALTMGREARVAGASKLQSPLLGYCRCGAIVKEGGPGRLPAARGTAGCDGEGRSYWLCACWEASGLGSDHGVDSLWMAPTPIICAFVLLSLSCSSLCINVQHHESMATGAGQSQRCGGG